MLPRIFLVNPPIYDFTAYDFWLKPYGMLRIAGCLRGKADFILFDYLDRLHSFMADKKGLKSDQWGKGRFYEQKIPLPECLKDIPRYYHRFGLPHEEFQNFLTKQPSTDFALIQTTMTYWYPAYKEVIEDIRSAWPNTKIILGGNYVTLCTKHAKKLGADLFTEADNLQPLWDYMNIKPDLLQPALWEAYEKLSVGILKLSDGCPFSCTYCSVPKVYGKFKARPLQHSLVELELLYEKGAKNIAFYDDALLFKADELLIPFLQEVLKRGIKINFHSPNALNARFVSRQLAEIMTHAGFKTFYLGFESASEQWQKATGEKVTSEELKRAVKNLTAAGAEPANIIAYQILGHPCIDTQQLESSMRFVNSLGIRGVLADFSPIPETPDGELARKWVDMDEPLMHNKTAFPIIALGFDETNRLKNLQRDLNRKLISRD